METLSRVLSAGHQSVNLTKLPLTAVFKAASETAEPKDSPLLIVLHGRGDSPEGFFWMPEMLALPRLNYLLLQAPDDYYGGFSWYGMPPNQLPGILRSRKLLEETLQQVFAEGYLAKNVLLFGFSQGCLMTLEFGGRFGTKLAGYIGVSGYVYDPKALAAEANPEVKHADWLVTHGTADDVLPVERTREQIKELQQAGFKIEYLEYPKTHTLDDRKEIPYLREWIATRI